jgi:ATP-binding cassette subfamily A (ABC1) protein 3
MSFKKKTKVILDQLWLLLWKSFLLQKRSIISTIIELLLPCIFSVILLPIRSIIDLQIFNETVTFKPFQIENIDFQNFNSFVYYPNNSETLDNLMIKTAENLKFNASLLKCK